MHEPEGSGNPQAAAPPQTAVDAHEVLKRNRAEFVRRLSIRVCVFAVLCVTPSALAALGAPNAVWTVLPGVVGIVGFVWSAYTFLPAHLRLNKCKRVLQHYPVGFRAFARRKDTAHNRFGTIFEFVVAEEGDARKSRRMRGVEPQGRGRWPESAENGVWVAGDPAFGGVAVVPESGTLLLMQPAKWEQALKEREQAGAERNALARQAGLGGRAL